MHKTIKINGMIGIIWPVIFLIFSACKDKGKTENNVGKATEITIVPTKNGYVAKKSFKNMDTFFSVSVGIAKKAKQFGKFSLCSQKLKEELNRLEKLMSSHNSEGDVYSFNTADSGWIQLSKDTFKVISIAMEISEKSKGAFDITWKTLHKLYDFKKTKWQPPSKDTVKKLLQQTGFRNLELDKDNLRIKKSISGLTIDLGGIAKGYALEKLSQILLECGFPNHIVNGGGDMVIRGSHPDRSWTVQIRNPRKKEMALPLGKITDMAVVTSGDYERYFIYKEERYSHIIDPRTGFPSKNIVSVTVTGKDAIRSDAIATAIFVLGKNKGIEFIETISGYECLLFDENLKVFKSSGFDKSWKSGNNHNF